MGCAAARRAQSYDSGDSSGGSSLVSTPYFTPVHSQSEQSRPEVTEEPSVETMKHTQAAIDARRRSRIESESRKAAETKRAERERREALASALIKGGGTSTWGTYSEPRAADFKVRGKHYIVNKKKVESGQTLIPLAHMECFRSNKIEYNFAEHKASWFQHNKHKLTDDSFVLIINLQMSSVKVQLVTYHLLPGGLDSVKDATNRSRIRRMVAEVDNQEWLDSHVKMIPRLREAPWVVKMAVKERPVILGKRVAHKYFSGKNYFEMDVCVDSSVVAATTIRLVHGWTASIVCDMVWLLEGTSEQSLPERIMAGVRYEKVNLKKFGNLSDFPLAEGAVHGATGRDAKFEAGASDSKNSEHSTSRAAATAPRGDVELDSSPERTWV